MKRCVIFLDDGGVMNDNTRRAAEWERLVGEFLALRLGGAPEAWGEANGVVFKRQWERFVAWQQLAIERAEHVDFFGSAEERQRWLREMCEHVGVVAPQGTGCVDLARQTEEYVIPRVRATFPGAVDAVRALSNLGYMLSTASSAPSKNLESNLTGMGVRDLFKDGLYGPDLVGALKGSSKYYPRIFAHARVDPTEALVVDDSAAAVAQAVEAGARAVLVARDSHPRPQNFAPVIRDLTELPPLLESII